MRRSSHAAGLAGSRRALLASVGAGVAGGLAGCLGRLGGGESYPDAAGPPEDDGEWTVTFEDRFEGGALDETRWSHGMGGATERCPSHDGPNHCWAADHVEVAEDRLRLLASDEEPDGPADYTFGAVCTDPHFAQEFGYFEARLRTSATTGTLPAFWLLADFDEHRYRELTFEARGVDAGEAIHHGYYVEGEDGEVHGPADADDDWSSSYEDLEEPLHEAYHVLGIEWGPTHVAYHVDGEEIDRLEDAAVREHLPGAPVYVLLTLGVMEGAPWVGYPDVADLPAQLDVDWVRAWQRDDWT